MKNPKLAAYMFRFFHSLKSNHAKQKYLIERILIAKGLIAMSSNKEDVSRAFENTAEQRREKIRAHVRQMLQKLANQHINERSNNLSSDYVKSDDGPGT